MDLDVVDPALRPALRRAPVLNLENRVVLRLLGPLSRLAPGKRTEGVELDGPGTDGGVNATPTRFPCDERNK